MEIIDQVAASSLEKGDTVRYDGEDFNHGELVEILNVEDTGDELFLTLEDFDEVGIHPDLYVDLYGYTDTEEI